MELQAAACRIRMMHKWFCARVKNENAYLCELGEVIKLEVPLENVTDYQIWLVITKANKQNNN